MGATFDPSGLYRFNAVQRMLADNGLTTARISAHVEQLQRQLLEAIAGTPLGRGIAQSAGRPSARPLPRLSQSGRGPHWCDELAAQNCVTDVRGDVIRIGLALYHDEQDVDAFAALAKQLSPR